MQSYRAVIVIMLGLILAVSSHLYLWVTGEDLPNRPYIAEIFTPVPYNTMRGDANAKFTLVEFFDYNCPYSRANEQFIKDFITNNPDFRLIYREYDSLGPKTTSTVAALAALASTSQNLYLRMHDVLLAKSSGQLTQGNILYAANNLGMDSQRLIRDMSKPELQAQINRNRELAQAMQFPGTPAFIVGESDLANNPNSPDYHTLSKLGTLTPEDLSKWAKYLRQFQRESQ